LNGASYNSVAMAIKSDEVDDKQLDWIILRDGGVQLYWLDEILSDDLRWLKSNGYKIISFDAAEWRSGSEWKSQRRMHESLKTKLSFSRLLRREPGRLGRVHCG
jgi:hypothetical protein